MRRVVGVDGGGTRTRAVIVQEDGAVLGYGLAGSSNYGDVGVAATRQNISLAVSAARQMAGIQDDMPFDAAFLGLGNVVSAADRAVIKQIAQDLNLAPGEKTSVDHDIRVALAGGLSGRAGIVLIAGTGSSCFGINTAGESWKAGGWGPLIDDEGSSYWLGNGAMGCAVRSADGRLGSTSLSGAVLAALGLDEIDDLMRRLYVDGLTRAETAALAPLVVGAARAGDAAALNLLTEGGERLADCVEAVARKLGMADKPVELAVTGGLTQAGEIFLSPLRKAVLVRLPKCTLRLAELPPAVGAALLALELLGIRLDQSTLAGLRDKKWNL